MCKNTGVFTSFASQNQQNSANFVKKGWFFRDPIFGVQMDPGSPWVPWSFGGFWGAFGSPGERLGASWGTRGRPWEGLGTPGGRLGDPLGPSWGLLGGTGGAFGCLFRVPEVLRFDF